MKLRDLIVLLVVGLPAFAANCGDASSAQPQRESAVPSLSFLVAPFVNRSGDTGQDYIAANITDDLVIGLSQIPGSFVIARSSSAILAREPVQIGEVKKKTDAQFLLRGEASLRDRAIHLAATLVKLDNGEQIWAARFEREFTELRLLERDIVVQIAGQLGASLSDARWPSVPVGRQDAVALDALLRAKTQLNLPQTAKTVAEARLLLEAARQADPQSVETMTGLASVHLAAALKGWGGKPALELQECERLLQQILADQPHQADALSLLGALRRFTGQRREALAAYEAAVQANPSDATAHAQIGRLQIDFGEAANALPQIELALRLSPLDPQRSLWFTFAGLALLYLDQPVTAAAWFEKSLAASPDFVTPMVFLSAALELDGHAAVARRTMEAARRISPALSIRRVEQQFAPEQGRVHTQWSLVVESLRRSGLPD